MSGLGPIRTRMRVKLGQAELQRDLLKRIHHAVSNAPKIIAPHEPIPTPYKLWAQAVVVYLIPRATEVIGKLYNDGHILFKDVGRLTLNVRAANLSLFNGIRDALVPLYDTRPRGGEPSRRGRGGFKKREKAAKPVPGAIPHISMVEGMRMASNVICLPVEETLKYNASPVCPVTKETKHDQLCEVWLHGLKDDKSAVYVMHRDLAYIMQALHSVGTFERTMFAGAQMWCQEHKYTQEVWPEEKTPAPLPSPARIAALYQEVAEKGRNEWTQGPYGELMAMYDNGRGFLEWLGERLTTRDATDEEVERVARGEAVKGAVGLDEDMVMKLTEAMKKAALEESVKNSNELPAVPELQSVPVFESTNEPMGDTQ